MSAAQDGNGSGGVFSGVARRMALAILTAGCVLILVQSCVQVYLAYTQEEHDVEARLDEIRTGHLPGIAGSLWMANDDLLRAQIMGVVALPDVCYAEVMERGRVVVAVGESPESGTTIERVYTLTHVSRGQTETIGSLRVVADLNEMHRRLRAAVVNSMVQQSAQTLFLAILVFFLFYRMVARPLRAMADYTRSMDYRGGDDPMPEIPVSPSGGRDELAELATAISDLRGEIGSAFEELMQTNAALRQEVEERTRAEGALRESKESLRLLAESLPVLIAHLGPDGRYQFVNRQFTRWSGLSLDQVVGHTADEMFPGDFGRQAVERIARALAGEELDFETRYTMPDGQRVDARTRYVPRRGADGRVESLYILSEDISARVRYEEQLKAALLEKEIMLREIHHRVKNNLQIVSSLLMLQADSHRDPVLQDLLRQSRDRIAAMASVHDQLYRSENLAGIRMDEQIEQIGRRLVAGLAGGRSIAFECDCPPLELSIEQAVPLGLLLSELLTNALKHAFPGGRQGRVRVTAREEEDAVVIVVHDDGVGLPQDFDAATGGSLGMQLVAGLAAQLRGTISFSSASGGTEAELRFTR
ncbi:signal transduction histidine kinase [Desulfovibrio sp. X2]|uniref:histidine kinase dimerization/phosphoacceptor domain -containing protein n=1 Tax=Desulfovibrio sp. X2 TaxID=941449 RepID=UPI000358D5C7|nr:histidine kinase dimerization/phosphoacceptor domain -containing protein [Desulfovibrio sp. X2]EPR44538.1 signal transduction histidine kinase [Desulfovibrio sp. X2]